MKAKLNKVIRGAVGEKIGGKNSEELPFGYWEKCQGYDQAKNEIAGREVWVDTDLIRETIDDTYDVDNGIPLWDVVAQAIAEKILAGEIVKVKEEK